MSILWRWPTADQKRKRQLGLNSAPTPAISSENPQEAFNWRRSLNTPRALAGTRNRRLLVERKGPTRKIQNFDEVQAFLTHEGFETVFLEGMSIREQILLFQSAEFVIGTHGAGLTNLLFCEPGTKVLDFMPSVETRPFFWLISEGLNLRHAVQFCSGADGDI